MKNWRISGSVLKVLGHVEIFRDKSKKIENFAFHLGISNEIV